MARRAHIRDKCVSTIYQECAPSIGYHQKNSYLEDRIETTMKYFIVLDDLNNKGAQIEKVKKEMFKIMRILRQRDEEGINVKREPLEVLDEVYAELNPEPLVKVRGSDVGSSMSSPCSPMYDKTPQV